MERTTGSTPAYSETLTPRMIVDRCFLVTLARLVARCGYWGVASVLDDLFSCTSIATLILVATISQRKSTHAIRPFPFNGARRVEVEPVGCSHPITIVVELVDERLAPGGANLKDGDRDDVKRPPIRQDLRVWDCVRSFFEAKHAHRS